jgi:5-formyltetrahydrofolate cyclo-ligase
MRDLKNSVRQEMRKKRELLSPDERHQKSLRISNNVLEFIKGETVMVYGSKEMEVNTSTLIKSLFERGNPVIVPVIVKADISLRLSYLRDISVLVPSTFGVPEPIGSEISAKPEDVDVIILPMLGFDRKGGRLGYGAGYYDRFLERNPKIRKIGIAFACQEAETVPVDEKDIRMDLIITENGTAYTGGKQ